MDCGAIFTTIYFAWAAAMAFTLGFLFQVLARLTIGLFLPYRQRVLLMGLIFRTSCAIFFVYLNPFWSVRVRRTYKKRLPKRCILMCNHLTYADSFVLTKLLMPTYEAKFVAKADIFSIPLAGWGLRMQGDLPVKFERNPAGGWRTQKGTAERMMAKVDKYLANDIPIMVFPEGKLSPDGELTDFKNGFFEAALRNKVPIVPLAMWGNRDGWPRDVTYMKPARMEIGVGAPIELADGETVESLKARVRGAIVELRNGLPIFKRRPLDAEVVARDKASAMVAPASIADDGAAEEEPPLDGMLEEGDEGDDDIELAPPAATPAAEDEDEESAQRNFAPTL